MNTFRKVWSKLLDIFFPNKNETVVDYLPSVPPKPPHYPDAFSTDGCSGGMSWFWRKILRRVPPWEGCCIEHDLAYWAGGFWLDRKQADLELMMCVKKSGHPFWAVLIYWGVRIGGAPIWPFPWRWGYGFRYVARYEQRDGCERINASKTDN